MNALPTSDLQPPDGSAAPAFDDRGWTPERRALVAPLGVRIFRSFAGVIVALFFFIALAMALEDPVGIPDRPAPERGRVVALGLLLAGAAIPAGFLAGWIAGRRPVLHGLALGVLAGWGHSGLALGWQGVPWEVASWVGLLWVAPFGALGAALRRAVAAAQARAAARARRDGLPDLPFAVRARPELTWLGVFLALMMTAAAGWALVSGRGVGLGIAGLGVFGVASVVLGVRALRPRPFWVLTDQGIEDHRLRASIPWSAILAARPLANEMVAVVALVVIEPARFFTNLPWTTRWVRAFAGQSASHVIAINLTGTNVAAPELCALVAREVARRRDVGTATARVEGSFA